MLMKIDINMLLFNIEHLLSDIRGPRSKKGVRFCGSPGIFFEAQAWLLVFKSRTEFYF